MNKSYGKWFLTKVKKAINDFSMINKGDKIGVGVSGGKDSITLLFILNMLKKFSHLDFELQGITLDMGWDSDYTPLIDYCKEIDIPLHIEKTQIAEIIFQRRKEKNPCSLCSKLRGGALNRTAKSLDCNTVALGHHSDDVIETLLLNMVYAGRLGAFKPNIYLDRIGLKLVRPMVYVKEQTIKSIVENEGLPVIENPCPANGKTKRDDIKDIISSLEKIFPPAKENILTSIKNMDRFR